MNWIKTGKTTGPDGTVIFYELEGTEFWIESRTKHIPHANRIGTWDHTTYVVRKGPDAPELAVKNRLRDAKEFVEQFMGGAYSGND